MVFETARLNALSLSLSALYWGAVWLRPLTRVVQIKVKLSVWGSRFVIGCLRFIFYYYFHLNKESEEGPNNKQTLADALRVLSH